LKKTLHKKGQVEWVTVKVLSSSPLLPPPKKAYEFEKGLLKLQELAGRKDGMKDKS
jgi:hypothetical protein